MDPKFQFVDKATGRPRLPGAGHETVVRTITLDHVPEGVRCLVTGHQLGTDTWAADYVCPCDECQRVDWDAVRKRMLHDAMQFACYPGILGVPQQKFHAIFIGPDDQSPVEVVWST